ncbi:uncharacterized protein Bfra_009995 [Botrytis fragariae]|uniref:2EXR domain-containing protein n=1 Tax=Botrytis fragariae TaxID=1964551 RepID=A0A8H6ANG0_9HELO|nr:uncharacterized protein Bfra_009995 [Botrytis fragariae]KAF5870606.1 hypothetical protein Bfra_009995 [Botrytis fragariae]
MTLLYSGILSDQELWKQHHSLDIIISQHHPPSISHTENKKGIPLTTSQENQPLSTTLQSIMAPSFDSCLPKGYKAAKPTKALDCAEKPILIIDDDSNQPNTDQTKGLIVSSPDWKEKGKGKGKEKEKEKEKGKATEAYHTYQEQEIDAVRTLVTLSKTIHKMSTAPSDNKKETGQLATDKMAHETSEHRKKLPTEIWIKIWELVANDNPRNLDIWTWSEGPEKLWENEKQRIINGPLDYASRIRWNPFKFITTQVVPPMLHVSCLSRYIGLEYYKLGFGCHLGMPKIPSEDYSILEPRIYYHKNDLVCPMGRFSSKESECFWEQLPEEISAIALNLGKLKNIPPKLHENSEDYNNQIAHEHFSYEYSRGLIQDPDRLDELELPFFGSNRGKEFSKRASKIYLYCFVDYISKQGPRDFRFTPLVGGSNALSVHGDVDSDFSFGELVRNAHFSGRVDDHGLDDMYLRWEQWLRYGGLTWLKDGGTKPGWIQIDNPTAYDRDRNEFFRFLEPWEEAEFIKRGVPNIGMNSKFWVPGVPEVHSMKLEIHG